MTSPTSLSSYFSQVDVDEPAVQRTAAGTLLSLVAAGLDRLPLPGQGATYLRWQCLARVAAHDLSLAKLYEGHTDALAILAELRAPIAKDNTAWGVWCAEVPHARVQVRAENEQTGIAHLAAVRLDGTKAWCSGAADLQHALLSACSAAGDSYLVAVDLSAPGVSIDASQWAAIGMADSASLDVAFDDVPGVVVGSAGAYLARAGFWQGGAGVAACWYGAAAAIAHSVRGPLARTADPHFLAHLGAIEVALRGAGATLRRLADMIDSNPQGVAVAPVLQARLQVEEAATAVMTHAGRALGAAPFCRDKAFARRMADLPIFVRQSHAERDLAFLGTHILEGASTPWTL